ncbi:bifunctional glycosyltransferase family 2/GtrA family protein [Actinomyces sp. MRS3W]|uniref:bifunctional glycosyltransferase family 2/GtrA family protein n=1 Tax=Actinomyces sp. MRS3W TaxID=2800796 RepID=UPI0028FD35F0|nr:bifunctional glycosyltransferase family 2/GtrA family protein [Actinomyces sp. MRS3W]MDU0347404.1 bifunctional glycosyltransferase family 2/GtrA family protein [Actinomyces sp. MRS3W]
MSTPTRPDTGSFPTRRLRPDAAPPTAYGAARQEMGAARSGAGPAQDSGPDRGPAPATASAIRRLPQVGLVVLIPAYQPDMRLAELVADLVRELPGCRVLVVDDGSGPEYARVFRAASARGADVVGYATNRGKGQALRTGLARAAELWPDVDIVCADADGQHRPADIAAVARRVRETGRMTLGVRRFTGKVPLRSRIGNDATALLFRLATGWKLRDTQTGLRGYPAGKIAWLMDIPGDRYEYELSVLLRANELDLEVEEVEIATVYEPGNASSHFRPLQDSARIYAPLLRFIGASLASFGIDWAGVMLLHLLTGNLLISVVGARLVSGTANFFMNRRVFRAAPGTVMRTAVRYVTLALTLLAASYLLLRLLTGAGIPLGVAKPIGDGVLYVVSYLVQQRAVFREKR